MVVLGLFLALLALVAESVAVGITVRCEQPLGPNSVRCVQTNTSTNVETITITDKIISRDTGTVRPIATTTTINTTISNMATVTAGPEVKTATSTVTSTYDNPHTQITTETQTNTNTITSTSFFNATISKKPNFTAILDTTQMESSDKRAKTQIGADVQLFLFRQTEHCTKELPLYTRVTFTIFRQETPNTTEISTETSTSTITTTVLETQYPSGLNTTVTVTVLTLETQIDQDTHHAACSSDNILQHATGNRLITSWTHQDSEITPTEVSANNPVDCCIECMKRPYCRISFFGRCPDGRPSKHPDCYLYLTLDRMKCAEGQQPLDAMYIGGKVSKEPPPR
ncbi:hypothetical protein FNYG_15917 [Fusarium nygamai]|uniref:Apple domain-containing protein n=1 Tax=Gibberella nygamai TaxID=42673 RepID=A0A2K0U074_GIBNY|nr:hypothetical protein FNYG_15917 [Fusarium nygamai]